MVNILSKNINQDEFNMRQRERERERERERDSSFNLKIYLIYFVNMQNLINIYGITKQPHDEIINELAH